MNEFEQQKQNGRLIKAESAYGNIYFQLPKTLIYGKKYKKLSKIS